MKTEMRSNPKPFVIGVGEVLWDLLPAGKQLGGAPANFAYHAHALGAEALVVSRVGDDALGREILERLQGLGLRTDGISVDPGAPTGTVSVALDAQGVPNFTIHENVAWDLLEAGTALLAEAARADVICFGTLGQRHAAARAAIRAVLRSAAGKREAHAETQRPQREDHKELFSACSAALRESSAPAPLTLLSPQGGEGRVRGALRIFDINLRQRFYSREVIDDSLRLANVLKLNDAELPVVAGMLDLAGDERAQLEQLAARYGLRAIALTKGAQGSLLLVCGAGILPARFVSRPSARIKVVDTVGAGDAYTAALALGLLAGHEPERIQEHAHRVAEFVCTQPGATPQMPASR